MKRDMVEDWEGLPDFAESDLNAPVEVVGDMPGMGAFEGAQIKAADLMNKPFDLLAVRRLTSHKSTEGYFYVAQCRDPETKTLFSTTLGGPAVLRVVNAWLSKGAKRPLRATLKEHEGGEYGHYNVLE